MFPAELTFVLIAKRKQPEEDDNYLEGARSSKLARLWPSEANDPSKYQSLQENQQERILDDCSRPDIDIPPLPLIYRGFGVFHDMVENPSANPPEMDTLTPCAI